MEAPKVRLIDEILAIGEEWGEVAERNVRAFLSAKLTRGQTIRFVKQRCWNELQGARLFSSAAARFCNRIGHDLVDFLIEQAHDELRHHGFVFEALTELGETMEGFEPHPALVEKFEQMLAPVAAGDPLLFFASVQATGEVEGLKSIVPICDLLKGTPYDAVARAHKEIVREEEGHTTVARAGLERCGTVESLSRAKDYVLNRAPRIKWERLFADIGLPPAA
jgi:uncharacterized ferritin-like protein (DUF455 family)